jgi:hypothetical protein
LAGCASGLVRLPLRGQLRLDLSPEVTRLPASRLTRPSLTGSQSTNITHITPGQRQAGLDPRGEVGEIGASGPATYNEYHP